MSITSRTSEPVRARKGRLRKLGAILAGGAVLGVGAAFTLAAWNDSEFATGTFGSGLFDIQGSLDGATFTSSDTAPGKSLVFEMDAGAMAPGDSVYAPFAVQLAAASSYEADVSISAVSGSAISAELSYTLIDTGAGFECDETTTGSELVVDADAAASGPTAVFSLDAVTAPVNLCFIVTAGADLPPGESGTVTWEFVGESTTPLP